MKTGWLSVSILLSGMAAAQISQAVSQTPEPAVSYNSASELNQLLSQLQHTAQTMQLDLASLSIERWKTDSNTKRGSAADVESIQRNIQTALPGIMDRLRNSPENLSVTFELYRNLDALYSVLTSVVESAGAFGTRNEYQSLQNDLNAMEMSRRSFADRMEKLTTAKESEVADLRAQLKKAQGEQAATSLPKKVVVDDTDEAKKPIKKKPVHKKPKPATSSPAQSTTGSRQSNSGSQPQNPPSNPPQQQ
ncbi:MAG TPA: hypothetical protein VMB18_16140 [Terriglobales bacterium]|nr:hypothetical protein [Terriglobales bacterium]